MKCDRPQCDGEMDVGIALNSSVRETGGLGGPAHVADADDLDFIPVMKCRKCGRSLDEWELRNKR